MNNMDSVRMLEFNQTGMKEVTLLLLRGIDIPFQIKRIFYIFGSKDNVVRGQHASRKTEFVLINVTGNSKICIKDGKGNQMIYYLNRPIQEV